MNTDENICVNPCSSVVSLLMSRAHLLPFRRWRIDHRRRRRVVLRLLRRDHAADNGGGAQPENGTGNCATVVVVVMVPVATPLAMIVPVGMGRGSSQQA